MHTHASSRRPGFDAPDSNQSTIVRNTLRLVFGALLFLLVSSSSAFAQTTLSPRALSFGNVPLGLTTSPKSVTLRNPLNVPLTINGISTGGESGFDYSWGGTCPISPSTLAPGQTCSITVTFHPFILGSLPGTLMVFDTAPNSPQSVSLTGTGISPVSISPAALNFSSQFIDTTSLPKTVTLTNIIASDVSIFPTATTGDFAVVSNNCPSSLGAGLSCSLGVTFTPIALGPQQGTLLPGLDIGGINIIMMLNGTGNDSGLASISVTPASASFAVRDTLQFTATGHLKNGTTLDLTPFVKWTSSAPGTASIAPGGLATGIAAGSSTIIATLGTIVGSTSLTVTIPVSADFVLTGSLNTVRYFGLTAVLNNGKVLIAGGANFSAVLASSELYDPAAGIFSYTGSLNTARAAGTATLLNDGTVLIVGGSDTTGAPLASAELYDPTTGKFSKTRGNLNTARFDHTATMLSNGMVLIAGGYNSTLGGFDVASAELYDPATEFFTKTGSLNNPRTFNTATLLNNGMVLIAAGVSSTAGVTNSAELYNPTTGTFTPTGSLNIVRDSQTATLLNNGMVLIVGGETPLSVPIAMAELYDPATRTFALTGSLSTGRFSHSATLLNNGTVLAAGGVAANNNTTVTSEIYTPPIATDPGFFMPTGNLNVARELQSAALLDNGSVLIAGGVDSPFIGGNVLASAELYQPASLTPANLVSIAITPATSTLSPGETQQFIATGTFSDNSTQQLASVTWSSSNASIAQITNDASNHGAALAVAVGFVTITAAAGTIGGTATLTVTNP